MTEKKELVSFRDNSNNGKENVSRYLDESDENVELVDNNYLYLNIRPEII